MPSSEPTTGRLTDPEVGKLQQKTMFLDAVNAGVNALQDGYVVVQPPAERAQAEALRGNTTKTTWKLLKKLYGQLDGSRGFNDFMVDVLVGKMGFKRVDLAALL